MSSLQSEGMSKLIHSLIEQSLDALTIPSESCLVSSLASFVQEVSKWNRGINLTGAKTAESFIQGPLFDSLTLLRILEKQGSMVDIGSGGGLPGIPASLFAPELDVTLVEPRIRRASFLRHAVHLLNIRVKVVESRDESLAPANWTSASSQAVWSPKIWLARAKRLLKPNGAVYVLSSDPITPEDIGAEYLIEKNDISVRPSDQKSRYSYLVRAKNKSI